MSKNCRRLNAAVQKLNSILHAQDLVAPNPGDVDSWPDGNKDCNDRDFPNNPFGVPFPGPGKVGWDPCAINIADPNCRMKELWDRYKDLCPECDPPGSLPDFFNCCATKLPPPYGDPGWDGNCENEPQKWRLCYRDTIDDNPRTHGWVCCRDGQEVWPANPDWIPPSGDATGQVSDPPTPPGRDPSVKPGGGGRQQPHYNPGFGVNPFGGPLTPPAPPGVYEGLCKNKDTNGKICCMPVPRHPAARWRGWKGPVPCINDSWLQWKAACDSDEGGEGSP